MEQLRQNPANVCPLTPLGFLERASIVYGDCTSIVHHETRYTWLDTNSRCLRLASVLTSLGIGRGHVVSIVAPNVPAMYEVHFAVPMAGAILNTLNVRLDSRTISALLSHGESKLVFVDEYYVSLVTEAISLLKDTKPPMLVLINDKEGLMSQPLPATFNYISTYEEMVEQGDPNFKWVQPESEWEPMVLNYTSGTTSSPKGVVHSHRGLYITTVDSLIDWSVPKQPVYLWTLPMFHCNGWSYPWGIAAVGGTNICLRKIHAPTIYDLIERHGVTHMCGAPIVLNMLSNLQKHLQNPVQVMTAGAPPPASVLQRAESLGFIVSHGYGLTEVAGVVVSCAWKRKWNELSAPDQARLKARQGVKTLGLSQVDVIDPSAQISVARDGSSLGEIVFRGPSIMLGYLKDPKATGSCIKENGWFYTGDVGVMHEDGYLEIKDRLKDVIISGGENISSLEVESVLYTHPRVNEAAVVAKPDDFWGETPYAFVTLRDGTGDAKPNEAEIIKFCKERLPHYMAPKSVVFREELPKTSTGKIQKFVLREIGKSL